LTSSLNILVFEKHWHLQALSVAKAFDVRIEVKLPMIILCLICFICSLTPNIQSSNDY
jgi:hypothetical protein